MMRFSALIVALGLLGLSACGPITPAPDYTIKVVPAADGSGYAALPPDCPRWADNDLDYFDNQPLPQFGCANARNMAMMIDRPEDMLQGRDPGPASGVTTVGAMLRYQNNQTRGLLSTSASSDNSAEATTAPTASSSMSGDTPPSSAAGK